MTREQVKSILPILQAYADGKEIQAQGKNGVGVSNWVDISDCHDFSTILFNYRVKPESEYRYFKDSNEAFEEMKKHEPFGWIKEKDSNCKMYILSVDNDGILLGDYYDDKVFLSYEAIFNHHTFVDGLPIGIKEKEV